MSSLYQWLSVCLSVSVWLWCLWDEPECASHWQGVLSVCLYACLCLSVCLTGGREMNVNVPAIDKERLLAHLDHSNPNTFEVEDLTRLIQQVCVTP